MEDLINKGFDAYIIGGSVRDYWLSEEPKDIDIFTNASGEEILDIFPQGKIIGNEERQKKILTVIVDGIEVSTYRSNGERTETGVSLHDHTKTCDFTINSMAMDINDKVIDFHGGRNDLLVKIIRAVGDPSERIKEDKLRVFRAVRFASRYDFKIEIGLMEAIHKTDISDIPVERIHDELYKILKYESGMEILFLCGLLTKIIPEFIPLIGMKGGHHHKENVDTHCFLAYSNSCMHTDKVIHHIACMLHDIGKGPCMRVIDGKIKFLGHDMKGSYMAVKILKRLKFSNYDIEYVFRLIRYHMWGISGIPGDKKFIKMFMELEEIDAVEDLVLLMYCDDQANLIREKLKYHDYLKLSSREKGKISGGDIIRKYHEIKKNKPFRVSDLKINGEDVLNLGIPPGKKIGKILNKIYNLTLDGIIKNERHEQLYWLRKTIEDKKGDIRDD